MRLDIIKARECIDRDAVWNERESVRTMPLVYMVEDTDSIRELVIYTLKTTGFSVRGFADGTQFEEGLRRELPDLVLMDIMLPTTDGVTLLGKMKAVTKTADIPVIMVTAKGSEYDKVMALDGGADDYVTKPFGMMELVSRIRAVLRRAEKQEHRDPNQLKIGTLVMELNRHEVRVDGHEVMLTLKEYNLLKMMMEQPEVVQTRDRILTEIWGYNFDGETRTVDVHIRSLRQKLGAAGECIETVRGVGYRIKE